MSAGVVRGSGEDCCESGQQLMDDDAVIVSYLKDGEWVEVGSEMTEPEAQVAKFKQRIAELEDETVALRCEKHVLTQEHKRMADTVSGLVSRAKGAEACILRWSARVNELEQQYEPEKYAAQLRDDE